MKGEEKHIDELFQQAFESYEPNVNQHIWKNISDKIGGNPPTSTGASSSSISGWSVFSIAVICGVLGAGIVLLVQNINKTSVEKKLIESKDIQNNAVDSLKTDNESKNYLFTAKDPVDQNDPLVIESKIHDKKYEIQIENFEPVTKKKKDRHIKKQPSSIVQLFLTPKTRKIYDNKHKNSAFKSEEKSNETTQVAIIQVEKEELNPVINSSVSGGYVPLVVLFEQSEKAQTVHWDFGDGVEANGEIVEHIFREPDDYFVKVNVKSNDGREATAIKKITAKSRCRFIQIPNIFTPNGDGENDTFYISGENIKLFFLQIFDLNGQVVYESDQLNSKWDGNDAFGTNLSQGQYIYVIKATGEDGTDLSNSGTLSLRR